MRVRLRRGILNCSLRLRVPGSTARCDRRIGADDQARLVAHPRGEYVCAMRAVAVTRTCASMYCEASQTDATRRWRAPAMSSATMHAGFALARTAARTQLEVTVMGSRHAEERPCLAEPRGFLAMLAARPMPGVPAVSLHYIAGVALGGLPAFAAAMALGALAADDPYAVLGQEISWGRSSRS
jgi:hypothetical protein